MYLCMDVCILLALSLLSLRVNYYLSVICSANRRKNCQFHSQTVFQPFKKHVERWLTCEQASLSFWTPDRRLKDGRKMSPMHEY